jgi:Co/Zn/Cd efflux system component
MRTTATRSQAQQRVRSRSPVDPSLIFGMAVMGLGAALFSLGVFHGFAHGSCSTTGYTAHYGPVPHCAGGTGWWMLVLTAGIFVALGGAMLSGIASTILAPVMFIGVGAPFIALGLQSGHGQLVLGSSSSTGRLEVAIFGACFAIAGLVWGGIAGRDVLSRLRFTGLLASVAGIGVAFLIATGVASAIGSSPATPLKRFAPSSAAVAQSRAATIQTSRAIARATAQARTATKLAACVTAAGTNTHRIQVCERKYVP